MTVHITDLHGMAYISVAQIAQNMVTKIATNELNFDPFTIYFYSWPDEPGDVISARFDGIIRKECPRLAEMCFFCRPAA